MRVKGSIPFHQPLECLFTVSETNNKDTRRHGYTFRIAIPLREESQQKGISLFAGSPRAKDNNAENASVPWHHLDYNLLSTYLPLLVAGSNNAHWILAVDGMVTLEESKQERQASIIEINYIPILYTFTKHRFYLYKQFYCDLIILLLPTLLWGLFEIDSPTSFGVASHLCIPVFCEACNTCVLHPPQWWNKADQPVALYSQMCG